jgi:S1-C subfamily serine protease
MLLASISYSQLNISTDYREDESWDGEEWIPYSSNNENTFFEFEDTLQSKMGMFVHRTNDITSAYLIKSYSYSEEYDLDEFEIVSDVGNKYTLSVKINWEDSEPSGYLTFLYLEGDGEDFRLVRHRIKNIWETENEEESKVNDEIDLYDGTFSFKEYFNEREDLDPIEGIWSLNCVWSFYDGSELLGKKNKEMISDWAIAYHDETKYKVYGLDKEADFLAYFEKTAVDNFYNYNCQFSSPEWKSKSNVNLENNSIITYGYFVDDIYVKDYYGPEYSTSKSIYWDFTWVKKYPLNTNDNNSNSSNDNRDWNGGGTGFFIDQSGYLATNYHVVEDAKFIEIEFYRDGELQTHKVEVVKEDKNNDLAILKISDLDFENFDALPYYFSTRVADVGEEVFALGYPLTNYLGKDIKFTDGKISSKTGYDGDIANYQTTTPIQPGNSGGPLFDYDGNLIAINAARFIHENSQNVSYSIKSSYLKNLIDVLPISLRLPDNKDIKSLKLTEKIKVLSDYVVLIKIR